MPIDTIFFLAPNHPSRKKSLYEKLSKNPRYKVIPVGWEIKYSAADSKTESSAEYPADNPLRNQNEAALKALESAFDKESKEWPADSLVHYVIVTDDNFGRGERKIPTILLLRNDILWNDNVSLVLDSAPHYPPNEQDLNNPEIAQLLEYYEETKTSFSIVTKEKSDLAFNAEVAEVIKITETKANYHGRPKLRKLESYADVDIETPTPRSTRQPPAIRRLSSLIIPSFKSRPPTENTQSDDKLEPTKSKNRKSLQVATLQKSKSQATLALPPRQRRSSSSANYKLPPTEPTSLPQLPRTQSEASIVTSNSQNSVLSSESEMPIREGSPILSPTSTSSTPSGSDSPMLSPSSATPTLLPTSSSLSRFKSSSSLITTGLGIPTLASTPISREIVEEKASAKKSTIVVTEERMAASLSSYRFLAPCMVNDPSNEDDRSASLRWSTNGQRR